MGLGLVSAGSNNSRVVSHTYCIIVFVYHFPCFSHKGNSSHLSLYNILSIALSFLSLRDHLYSISDQTTNFLPSQFPNSSFLFVQLISFEWAASSSCNLFAKLVVIILLFKDRLRDNISATRLNYLILSDKYTNSLICPTRFFSE